MASPSKVFSGMLSSSSWTTGLPPDIQSVIFLNVTDLSWHQNIRTKYMMRWIYARHPIRTTDIKFNPINHIDMETKLSPYTIASNCTDLTDIRDGINEIQEEMIKLVSEGKNVPSFFYSRLSKLQVKRKNLNRKTGFT